MAKKDLDGIDLILLILFLPFVIGYFLIVGIVKLIEKVNENTENYTRNGSGRRDFILEEERRQKKEQHRINRIRRRAEKENKKLANVARVGKLGHSLDLINQEFKFLEVVHKEVIEYKTIAEYKNFNSKLYFSARFSEISELVAKLYSNVSQNSVIYEEYKKKFFACNNFTPEEEIKQIPKCGMSVKKFKELEKKLFNEKIKTPPNGKIAIEIAIKYQQTKKLVMIDEVEIKRLLQEIEDEREYNFVCLNSFLYKELCELNKKYTFYDIRIRNFNIKCNSYSEYQKFDIRQYAHKRLMMKMDGLEVLYNQAIKNERLYNEYQKQYLNLSQYLRTEKEISGMKEAPLSIIKFQMLEKRIYSQMMLKEPIVSFSIYYKVEYTSPAGRNYYKKEECLTKKAIGSILSEIENEEIARREAERQKEILRAEKEEWRKEKRKEKSLQHREDKLAEKEALFGSIELREKRLRKKEEDLSQREEEFSVATRGHIYAVSDNPAPVEVEQPKIETAEESLSAWEKMKRLKKAYENGEITYEEYNEKRKHLL